MKLTACALIAAAAAPAAFANVVDECGMHALNVEYFGQALRNDGSAVDPARSDPFNALGHPEMSDTLNFVSLGFGGELVLSFGQRFGERVTVWETTYGDPSRYPESADVYVGVGSAWDSADWALVGNLANFDDGSPMWLADASVTLGSDAFDFLKIVDTTDPFVHNGGADGFDVDGVCTTAVPSPGPVSLAGLGLLFLGSRRRKAA